MAETSVSKVDEPVISFDENAGNIHIFNEKLPYVRGTVVFLRVEQSKKKFQKADDISSKITFHESLVICLSLRFRLAITVGLS